MSDETQDDIKPELDDWLASPFTKLALDRVKKESVPALLAALLRSCDKSTDPNVRYWYARYVSGLALEDFLAKGEIIV